MSGGSVEKGMAESKFIPSAAETRGAVTSVAGVSHRASILATQGLVCFLALAIIRPPFVMKSDSTCDTEHVSVSLLLLVAVASVGVTLSVERSQSAH